MVNPKIIQEWIKAAEKDLKIAKFVKSKLS